MLYFEVSAGCLSCIFHVCYFSFIFPLTSLAYDARAEWRSQRGKLDSIVPKHLQQARKVLQRTLSPNSTHKNYYLFFAFYMLKLLFVVGTYMKIMQAAKDKWLW